MKLGKLITSIFIVSALMGIGFFAGAQLSSVDALQNKTLEERVDDLEVRMTLLEATIAATSNDQAVTTSTDETHTITGEYVERPEVVAGDQCSNFYPAGTLVFISDWDGSVLGTGALGDGVTRSDGLCSQPFEIADVPIRDGYVINFERRAIGSAYEFTLVDLENNDWHIEVVSRYRN